MSRLPRSRPTVPSYPLRKKLPLFISITRLNGPIGIYLLLWPMLWALWFAAEGVPSIKNLFIFVAGAILTRSAGCIINDYADRNLDAHVERTKQRPLATGELSVKEALIAAAILTLVAFVLVLFTNKLTIMMSFVALILATIYPFTKRITYWPQAFLGLAFAFAVPMAFAAEVNHVPPLAWALFATAVILAIAYDTYYAMTDREFDVKMGMKSTAILFDRVVGEKDVWIVLGLHGLVLLSLSLIGVATDRGAAYYAGLFAALFFAIHQFKLAKTRQPQLCQTAFLNNHYLGLVIFIGIVLDFLLF